MRTAMLVFVAGWSISSVGLRADDGPKEWTFAGVMQAKSVDVRARVTGYVTRVAVKEGDAVAAGDLLIEIDPSEYALNLEAAKARLKAAEAKLTAAKIATANAEALLEKKVINQSELDLRTAAEDEVQAALMLASVEVRSAELTLSQTKVTAPFAGRVTRIRETQGGLIVADQTQIAMVASTDPLSVVFNVPEAILLQLRRDGMADPKQLTVTVGFADEDGFPHSAQLELIAPEVDPKTASARFRATVPNPDEILSPGMSARVHLKVGQP